MSLNIELIQESFNAIKPHADDAVGTFYNKLFSKYPDSQKLFEKVNMEKQRKLLIASLSHIVEYLNESEHLTDYLTKMGARHVQYGVEPLHYEWVGDSLLETFSEYFGKEWTRELRESWETALRVISMTMLEGAEGLRDEEPIVEGVEKDKEGRVIESHNTHLSGFATELVQKLLKEALERELSETLFPLARKKVREVLSELLEQEAKEAIAEIKSGQVKKSA